MMKKKIPKMQYGYQKSAGFDAHFESVIKVAKKVISEKRTQKLSFFTIFPVCESFQPVPFLG
jgi:hypothetical protein